MIKKRFTYLMNDMKQMKGYHFIAFIIFFGSIWIGYQFNVFDEFLYGQIEGLQKVASELRSSEDEHTIFNGSMFVFIFLNNAIKSILIVFAGMLFAIIPVFFLMVNGLVLGFVMKTIALSADGGAWLSLFLKGIIPHGILEIPAILIAAAYGIRFGTLVFNRCIDWIMSLFSKSIRNGSGTKGEIGRLVRQLGPLSLFLVVILLIAAFIESSITLILLKG